jgi:hypothetical protein
VHGFSPSDVKKVLGGNLIRVLEAAERFKDKAKLGGDLVVASKPSEAYVYLQLAVHASMVTPLSDGFSCPCLLLLSRAFFLRSGLCQKN